MVEIFEKKGGTIKVIEKPKIDLSLFKKKSNAKTYYGYLIQKMKEARQDGNLELVQLIQHFYKKYNELEKHKKQPLIEIEILQGWKGIDHIELFRGFEDDFVIAQHIKDKETGKVETLHHNVPKENVNRLLFWIKKWKIEESHKCYDFAEKLGFSNWKELWKERHSYFELYYFPIKVLEALGITKYNGRGNVTRIK